jgi:hypothetical protein
MPATATTSLESTNISDTYYGLLHAGGLPIPVTGQVRIRDGSGTQTALSLGANCNGATVCGTLKADTLQGTSLSLTNKITPSQLDIGELVKALHPVNSVIYTTDNVNPGTRSGWSGTTWTQIAQGRFIVGVGTGWDDKGISKAFGAENNSGRFTQDISVPDHYHGTGGFTGKANDDFVVINGGWDDGRGWTSGRWVPGNSNDNRTLNGDKNNFGARTSYPVAKSSYPIDTVPPGFGMYVWKRTA